MATRFNDIVNRVFGFFRRNGANTSIHGYFVIYESTG